MKPPMLPSFFVAELVKTGKWFKLDTTFRHHFGLLSPGILFIGVEKNGRRKKYMFNIHNFIHVGQNVFKKAATGVNTRPFSGTIKRQKLNLSRITNEIQGAVLWIYPSLKWAAVSVLQSSDWSQRFKGPRQVGQ